MAKRKYKKRTATPATDYEAFPALNEIKDKYPGKFAESTPAIWGIINGLCKDAAVYLEVGSWAGATLAAACHENKHLFAIAIDSLIRQKKNGKNAHIESLYRTVEYYGSCFIPQDYKKALPALKKTGIKADVYLYDGPHTEEDQYEGLALAAGLLSENATIIVDDANWEMTKKGTARFCDEFGWEVVFERLTEANGSPDYWNGIQILKRG